MIEITPVSFSSPQFESCLAIRIEVFVKEQDVPIEEELDALDSSALHVLALIDGKPVGTARAIEKQPGLWKIGRVAVCASYRQQGVGIALMHGIEGACPASRFTLSAQTHALKFYEKLGYVAEGAEFMDAGIPHFHMFKGV